MTLESPSRHPRVVAPLLLLALVACRETARTATPEPAPSTTAPTWVHAYLAGSRALERGDLDLARRALVDALRMMPTPASAYQFACVEARSGNEAAAFEALERARWLGFDDAALGLWDADLEPLRSSPRFADFLASLVPTAEPTDVPRAFPTWRLSGSLVPAARGDAFTTLGSGEHLVRCAVAEPHVSLLFGHRGELVRDFALAPTGESLLVASWLLDGPGGGSGALRVVDSVTGSVRVDLRFPTPCGISPAERSSRFIAHWSDPPRPTARVFDASTLTPVADLPGNPTVATLTPDGSHALLQTQRDADRADLAIYDVDRATTIATFDDATSAWTFPVAFTPDGRYAAIGDFRGWRVFVVDLADPTKHRTIDLGGGPLHGLTAISNTELLGIRAERTALRIALDRDELPKSFELAARANRVRATSSDGSIVLLGFSYRTVTALDTRTGAALWSAGNENTYDMSDACFLSDDAAVAIERDSSIEIVDARTGRRTGLIEVPFRETSVSFDPDGAAWLADGSDTIRRLDLSTGRASEERRAAVHGSSPTASEPVTFPEYPIRVCTADGGFVAEATERSVTISSARDGRVVCTFDVDAKINVLAFEPGDQRLWIGDDNSHVHVRTTTGEDVGVLKHRDLDEFNEPIEIVSVDFSPDGRRAVTASNHFGHVVSWDVRTLKRRWAFHHNTGNPAPMHARFGASGTRVYVYGQNVSTPRIVDAARGITILDLDDRGIWSLQPTPDERHVIAQTDRGLECIDANSGVVLWSRIDLDDGDWLLTSSDGHIDGTPGALQRTSALGADGAIPLFAPAATALDAKKVRASAAGVAVTPPSLH